MTHYLPHCFVYFVPTNSRAYIFIFLNPCPPNRSTCPPPHWPWSSIVHITAQLWHYKLLHIYVVPFTSGFYMLKLWVDCVCPQISVAKVKNCCLCHSHSRCNLHCNLSGTGPWPWGFPTSHLYLQAYTVAVTLKHTHSWQYICEQSPGAYAFLLIIFH